MRIASFNVENLFSRPRIMNQDAWADGKTVLAEYAKLNARLQKAVYTAADQAAIAASLKALGLEKADENKNVILRQNRGRLIKRGAAGLEVVAGGRADWIGWLALKNEAVNEVATRMTARVIQDVNADVLAVIEAEDRIALRRFDEQLMGTAHAGVMLVDGNDERGIDVGLLVKPGVEIESIVSHVDDRSAAGERIFSRDCPEYLLRAGGARVLVMVNHFKSKGYGGAAASNERRRLQAERARQIYDQRRAEGLDLIAIVGDFNDTPASAPLAPLMTTDLADISTHPAHISDGRPGTYANGTASNKIDYVLLSPALFARVTAGGVWRKGVWGGVNGTLFPHYEEMTRADHAASDHAAVWADVDLA